LKDPQSRDLRDQLVQIRGDLGRLILSPPRDPTFHRQRLRQLNDQKERLERELAARSAPFRRQREPGRVTATDLVQKLPPQSVFIDLLRYVRFEQDPKVPGEKGQKVTVRYLAFVLRPGKPPVRVELGEAGPIDAAVAAWQPGLASQPASAEASTLRRLVWDPLTSQLPANTQTVILAPEAAFTQFPWGALPGNEPGSVLLEDYAFAVVPNGPFLLECLTAAPASAPGPGLLLAVGGVQCDQQPGALPEPNDTHLVAWRPAPLASLRLAPPETSRSSPFW
jgi:hypothetical protein